jgi:formylglycine-generating enzyme required for sulfatase activity
MLDQKRITMNTFCAAVLVLLAQLVSCAVIASATPIEFSSNGMDFVQVKPTGQQAFGIGKYEVTVEQYVAFLNSTAASDNYLLYSHNTDAIARRGVSGSYRYASQPFMGQSPITYVDWFSAARFVNWMHNGRVAGGTEHGVYELNGRNQPVTSRNANATYWIPTSEEWAEAAYGSGDGNPSHYWRFATQSNTLPSDTVIDEFGDGSANQSGNTANYSSQFSTGYSGAANVGTSGGPSFYGTFDMGGNAAELVGYPSGPGAWGWDYSWPYRGGDWGNSGESMASDVPYYSAGFGNSGQYVVGFRVAAAVVPEPSTTAMALCGCLALLASRIRFRTAIRKA